MPIIPHEFARLALDRFEPCACSPEMEDDHRGLRLAGPVRIDLDALDTPFPVCGTYRVVPRFLNRFHAMAKEIVIVAINAESHRSWSTNLVRRGYTPDPSRIDERSHAFDTTILTGWFNLDLYRWIDGLPRAPGRYHVFATVGDVVSNVVTIEVTAP